MTELRRACGTLTVAQLNKALKSFPRMTEQSRDMARSFLVDGHLQVDIAAGAGVSRERVRFVCARVFQEHERLATEAAGQVAASVANEDGAKPRSNAKRSR